MDNLANFENKLRARTGELATQLSVVSQLWQHEMTNCCGHVDEEAMRLRFKHLALEGNNFIRFVQDAIRLKLVPKPTGAASMVPSGEELLATLAEAKKEEGKNGKEGEKQASS